jgi:pimeloyl-ACP methyl ester carboxylesterase
METPTEHETELHRPDRQESHDERINRRYLIAALALVPAAAYADGPAGTQHYVEVRGAKLYTQIYGRGPPIVFLHGGMGFFDISFAKQRDYFATYRTVVGIDQRGYGHSPDGPWSLSYQMMADDTAAVIDQLGLGPVDIVGHSDGANLALLLARDHPEMVRHLVISGANIRVALSSVEDNAEIFRDLPNGQLIIVPASNHGTFNKRPQLVNLAIREFLDQPDNAAPPY